mmetsp:Transcript_31535/g.86870  ORF Transcript_31535/g.86870 Transcript_31535/m.86870 type:complete len:198 (+) Transcript_31535:622-1215(+)
MDVLELSSAQGSRGSFSARRLSRVARSLGDSAAAPSDPELPGDRRTENVALFRRQCPGGRALCVDAVVSAVGDGFEDGEALTASAMGVGVGGDEAPVVSSRGVGAGRSDAPLRKIGMLVLAVAPPPSGDHRLGVSARSGAFMHGRNGKVSLAASDVLTIPLAAASVPHPRVSTSVSATAAVTAGLQRLAAAEATLRA